MQLLYMMLSGRMALFPTLVEIMLVYLLRCNEAYTKASMLYFGRNPLKEFYFAFLPYIDFSALTEDVAPCLFRNLRTPLRGHNNPSNESQCYKSLISSSEALGASPEAKQTPILQ